MPRILLARCDLLARQLTGGDRIMALDAGRDLAVGDALHFQRVQLTEIGDLVEAERGVLDEPDGGRLGHQRRVVHLVLLCRDRRTNPAQRLDFGPGFLPRRGGQPISMTGNALSMKVGGRMQCARRAGAPVHIGCKRPKFAREFRIEQAKFPAFRCRGSHEQGRG